MRRRKCRRLLRFARMKPSRAKSTNGLVVDGLASRATGSAECLAGEVMLIRRDAAERAVTVGADNRHVPGVGYVRLSV